MISRCSRLDPSKRNLCACLSKPRILKPPIETFNAPRTRACPKSAAKIIDAILCAATLTGTGSRSSSHALTDGSFDRVFRLSAESEEDSQGPLRGEEKRHLGQVEPGDAFEPGHVLPELAEGSVSVEQVSGGEREQIYLATRLALADVLARGERQLVVLDDVLTATDSGRLARVMGILEEAAQRLQVLVLTCHPERYRGLEGANFIDLEAIIRGG